VLVWIGSNCERPPDARVHRRNVGYGNRTCRAREGNQSRAPNGRCRGHHRTNDRSQRSTGGSIPQSRIPSLVQELKPYYEDLFAEFFPPQLAW